MGEDAVPLVPVQPARTQGPVLVPPAVEYLPTAGAEIALCRKPVAAAFVCRFLSAEKTHKFLLFSNKSEFVNASIPEFKRYYYEFFPAIKLIFNEEEVRGMVRKLSHHPPCQ